MVPRWPFSFPQGRKIAIDTTACAIYTTNTMSTSTSPIGSQPTGAIAKPAPTTLRGNQLHRDDQLHVLNANVSRFTRQRKPEWANKPADSGVVPSVQFADDDDWLANTDFTVNEHGRIVPGRWSSRSHPTWPDNPEKREGYVAPEDGAEPPAPAAPEIKAEAPSKAPSTTKDIQPFAW